MQGLHGLKNFTLFYSEFLLLEKFFKWLQHDSKPQPETSLAKWLSGRGFASRCSHLDFNFFFTFKNLLWTHV